MTSSHKSFAMHKFPLTFSGWAFPAALASAMLALVVSTSVGAVTFAIDGDESTALAVDDDMILDLPSRLFRVESPNPVLCVDFSNGAVGPGDNVAVDVVDPNGDVETLFNMQAINYVAGSQRLDLITSSYILCEISTGSAGTTSSNTKSGSSTNGGFVEGAIFNDQFNNPVNLSVVYTNAQVNLITGLLTYSIEVRNEADISGVATAEDVRFVEYVARDDTVQTSFDVQCTTTPGASCGELVGADESERIRRRNIVIPTGGMITFDVERDFENEPPINLHGAVFPAFSTADLSRADNIDVVGSSGL